MKRTIINCEICKSFLHKTRMHTEFDLWEQPILKYLSIIGIPLTVRNIAINRNQLSADRNTALASIEFTAGESQK